MAVITKEQVIAFLIKEWGDAPQSRQEAESFTVSQLRTGLMMMDRFDNTDTWGELLAYYKADDLPESEQ